MLLASGKGAGQWRKIASKNHGRHIHWSTVTGLAPDGTRCSRSWKGDKGECDAGKYVEDTGKDRNIVNGPSVDNIVDSTLSITVVPKKECGIALVGTSGQGGNKTARHPAINNS